jgi:hypothetical protein
MGLQEELEKIRPSIQTDSYPMSIGEWASLYDRGELDIHPEFQRFFRWDENQKSRFIESILLNIPIPPIFVSQRNDGVWDVVDGLQRLSTIFEFMGTLKKDTGETYSPLVLIKTTHLPSLQGKKWSDSDDPENSFDVPQRLYIKRAKLYANIILKESGNLAKYELFQRINTGGSQLSEQEIRNCILVQINPDMYRWLDDLAHYENFCNCTVLTEKAQEERYDQELVLRFLSFRREEERGYSNIGDLNEYMTNRMIAFANSPTYDRDTESKAFRATFDILAQTIKENSFRRFDANKNKFVGGFLVTPYEVIALGIGYNYPIQFDLARYEGLVKQFWSEGLATLRAGSGIRASTRIPDTLPYGRKLFSR